MGACLWGPILYTDRQLCLPVRRIFNLSSSRGVSNPQCEIIHQTPSRATIGMLADSSYILPSPSPPPIRLHDVAFLRRDIYTFTIHWLNLFTTEILLAHKYFTSSDLEAYIAMQKAYDNRTWYLPA